jgi:tripartite motif-containing protein 9/67
VGKRTFAWDPNAKGPNINLLNGNLTANKKQAEDYQTVLGTVEISSGKHYWEVKIEKFVEIDDIIIGISQKGIDINQRPFDTGKFWGWICTGGRKLYPSQPGGPA